MRKIYIISMILMFSLFLCSCGCDHQWTAANCIAPSTCELCDKTEGELAEHLWMEATCSELKTCSVCGATEGELLPHTWADATCIEPQICSACGATDGEPNGHSWDDATCTEPQICVVCKEETGAPLGHSVEESTDVQDSTCSVAGTAKGICTICGETIKLELPLLEHIPGEWVTQPVSEGKLNNPQRTKLLHCIVCEKQIDKETYKLTPEELETDYKAHCEEYDYEDYARYPDKYKGKYVRIECEARSIYPEGNRLMVVGSIYNRDNRPYMMDCFAFYYTETADNLHLLEHDEIVLYGYFDGTFSGPTIVAAPLTMTLVQAEYIDLK